MTIAPVGPNPSAVGPLPSVWVAFAALNADPNFDCHNFNEVTKLYSMPSAYNGFLLDIGCRIPGQYQIDFRSRVSEATKMTEFSVLTQLVEFQRKQGGIYVGGIQAENVSAWTQWFSEGTARAKLRKLIGPVCTFLDEGKIFICQDASGDLDLQPLPSNTQLQVAYSIWRTKQLVNQCRAMMQALQQSMGWKQKVEAFCRPGFIASNCGSVSTDDMPDIPPSYDRTKHDILVTGTPDAEKLRTRLEAGQTHYIDSAHLRAGQPLPGWWPTTSGTGA